MGGTPSESKKGNAKDKRIINFITNSKRTRGSNSFTLDRTTMAVNTGDKRKTANGKANSLPLVPSSSSKVSPPALMLLEMEVASSYDSGSDDMTHDTTCNSSISSSCSFTAGSKKNSTEVVEPHIATKVQFSTIEIRSYNVTIGDHPCCTVGCPITLDWDYNIYHTNDLSIDEYEILKQNYCLTVYGCTKRYDLRISPEERVELLLLCSQKCNDTDNSYATTTSNINKESQLSELEIRRASRKFHRTKSCSVRQCERIHETFFHCPLKNQDDHDDDDDDDI